MTAAAVAVYQIACIYCHKRAYGRHALVLAVSAAVNISEGVAVSHKSPVHKCGDSACFTKCGTGFYGAGNVGICLAVYDSSLVNVCCYAACKVVALICGQCQFALNIAAVNNSTLVAAAVGVHYRCDTADIRTCFIGNIDKHICQLDVLNNSISAESAEKSDVILSLGKLPGCIGTADGHTLDGVALTVKASVEYNAAVAYGSPLTVGNIYIICKLDVCSRVVDMLSQ